MRPLRFRLGLASGLAAALGLLGGAALLGAPPPATLPAAPPGLVETGIPSFQVVDPEALGLSSPPYDLHLLPDGRVLVVAAQELALGDGVRWETFARAADTEPVDLETVIVDTTGTIYAGVPGGFARIEFSPDAHWRYVRQAAVPADPPALRGRLLTRVTEAGGEWYWSAGNGALLAWSPGRDARVLGFLNDFERIVAAGGSCYVSDPSNGGTFRIARDGLEPLPVAPGGQVERTISCGAPAPDGTALVGTYNLGVCRFDGRDLQPLAPRGALSGRQRITDLCATDGGLYCAALDNVGLAFFDSAGRVLQLLDRSVDHRFGRVRRLRAAPGLVWALLNDGVAQIEFPARLSHFESLVPTSLTYAQLTRHEGRLWLLAGGRIQAGRYDEDGRLVGFDIDSPGPFASSVHSAAGHILGATAEGLYWKSGDTWRLAAPAMADVNLCRDPAAPERWLVVARDELGWLRAGPEGPVVERIPAPGLGTSYSTLLHAEGAFWAELGASRCARITLGADGRPSARVFDQRDGFPDGWVQAFVIDGRIRFNLAGRIFRHDPATDRIVPDPGFLPAASGLGGMHGRPARDPRGRLWIATDQTVCVLDTPLGTPAVSVESMPPALRPISFVTEETGVVWMHQRQRLVRFDPAMPAASPAPLRALISHVQLASSSRHWIGAHHALPDLDYRDNSLVFHFLAPHRVFREPVGFEVRLEGADEAWSATGPAGVASFNRLREGRYVLHVRPRAGAITGIETALAFTIRPPWFRTPLAYTLYGLAVLAVILGGFALWSHLARRERAHLARLVAARTAELGRSEERYRLLSESLERRVQARTAELTASNRELESFSYSVSHDLRAPLRNINGFAELLRKRLCGGADSESLRFLRIINEESVRLSRLIDALLTFARLGRAELNTAPVSPARLVEDIRGELAAEAGARRVEWRVAPLPEVHADPTLLRQVLFNLLANALKFTRGREPAVIEIGTLPSTQPGEFTFFVRDNGAGFDPKYAEKLFGVFQRLHHTRDFEGSGIGLATIKRIIGRHGGRIWAESAPGAGATFYFTLPSSPRAA